MNGEDRFFLKGTERYLLPGATKIGSVDTEITIPVSFYIATENPGLRAEADAMAAKAICNREYYSREALYAKYPPSPDAVEAVKNFASDNKLKILPGERFGSLINLDVPLLRAKELFGTELNKYRARDGYDYRGRMGMVSLPGKYFAEKVRPKVVGVFGLDNRQQAVRSRTLRSKIRNRAHQISEKLAAFAFASPAGDGSGQCVGVLEFGGQLVMQDIPYTTNALIKEIPPPPHTANPPGRNFSDECQLDAAILQATVPNAKKVFYILPNSSQGWMAGLEAILSDTANSPAVLSVSWGYDEIADNVIQWTCSDFKALEDYFARTTLLGITVCCCSGDEGIGNPPGVYYPASSQYVLTCGGTSGSKLPWCDDNRGGASGGGISHVIPRPAWQDKSTLKVTPTPPGEVCDGRRLPDVAPLALDNITGDDGTSVSTPRCAALIIQANQQIKSGGLNKTVGNITTLLYDEKTGLRAACDDVTSSDPCLITPTYAATSGWDACTGWGIPRDKDFIDALVKSASPGAPKPKLTASRAASEPCSCPEL